MQVGAFYERKIYKQWYAGIGYMEWNTLWNGTGGSHNEHIILNEWIRLYTPVVGKLEARMQYKMMDAYFFYRYSCKKSFFYINIGAGLSYNWGLNSYLAWYTRNPGAPYDYQLAHYNVKARYWGVIPQISCDFWLLKNRINIGNDFRARYYPGRVKIQYDFGIHVGVNF